MAIKQYFYKVKNLPVQNIGTGNKEHQALIEKHLKDYLEEEQIFELSAKHKTVSILSKDLNIEDPVIVS